MAHKTQNSGRVLSVEPDSAAHPFLEANRAAHLCNVHIVKGTISNFPSASKLNSIGYSANTRHALPGEPTLFNLLPAEAAALLGQEPTALVIDCEGCIGSVLLAGINMSAVQRIIIEEDGPQKQAYGKIWYPWLLARGFQLAWRKRSITFLIRSTVRMSQFVVHSVWQRGGLRRGQLSCTDYARVRGWGKAALLDCLPLAVNGTKPTAIGRMDAPWAF